MVMATVQMPNASGIAAAASEPNTASNTIRMIGRFQRSAAAMSCLVLAAAAVLSAPWPMTYSRTLPFSICPGRSPWTPTFVRSFLAASLALLLFEESRRNDTTYGRSGCWRWLGRIFHHRDVGDLAGDLLQKRGSGVHVFVAGIRAWRRH